MGGYAAFVIIYNLVLRGPTGLIPDYLDTVPEIREFVADEEFFGYLVLAMVVVYATFAAPVGYVAGSAAGRIKSSLFLDDQST